MPRGNFNLVDLISLPPPPPPNNISRIIRIPQKNLVGELLCIFGLLQAGSFIFFMSTRWIMLLMFHGGLCSFILHQIGFIYCPRAGSCTTHIALFILLLSRCCSSRCTTFLAKRATFLAKCFSLIISSNFPFVQSMKSL